MGIDVSARRLVKEGSRGNASIYEGMIGDCPVIVKDFRSKSFIVRHLWGPLSIRRERRAYQALQGVAGIARSFPSGDPLVLAIARIEGVALSGLPAGSVSPDVFDRLEALIGALHSRRVVHLDITHRGNILVSSDGQPWLIDLASAVDLSRLGALGRWLCRVLGFFDRAAVAKWKRILCQAPLSAEEERDLGRLYALQRFWIFNRK